MKTSSDTIGDGTRVLLNSNSNMESTGRIIKWLWNEKYMEKFFRSWNRICIGTHENPL